MLNHESSVTGGIVIHPRRITFILLIVFCAIGVSGCSILLAKTGRYQDIQLHPISKENVHRHLGVPALTGRTDNIPYAQGSEYEIYYVRGPLHYAGETVEFLEMADGTTLYLAEIVLFPVMLIDRATGIFFKHTLYFVYEPDGSIEDSSSASGRCSPQDLRLVKLP